MTWRRNIAPKKLVADYFLLVVPNRYRIFSVRTASCQQTDVHWDCWIMMNRQHKATPFLAPAPKPWVPQTLYTSHVWCPPWGTVGTVVINHCDNKNNQVKTRKFCPSIVGSMYKSWLIRLICAIANMYQICHMRLYNITIALVESCSQYSNNPITTRWKIPP